MFLMDLNEKDRKNFLELASYTMKVDGNIDAQETNMFQSFRAETRLSEEVYKIKNKELKDIIKEFQGSTKRSKKIVIIELFGIILANDDYDETQKEVIEQLTKDWNLRGYEVNKMKRWVEDMKDLLIEGYGFIENN